MAGHDVNYKRTKENDHAATIDNNSDFVLLFTFRRSRSTHCMAGHNVYYKRTKENEQAATIDNNSNPAVPFSFCRHHSIRCMAGHDVYYKRTKENDHAATMENNGDTRATINNNNPPLPRKWNNKLCVVLVELE